jgi:hypothetical protein
MPRFNIHHITKYTYEGPVRDSANQIILFPIKDEYQEVLKQDLSITGEPAVEIYKDYYGNEVGSFTHADPHTSLIIDSGVEVITKPRPALSDKADKEEQWNCWISCAGKCPISTSCNQEPFAYYAGGAENCLSGAPRSLTPLEAARQLRTICLRSFQIYQRDHLGRNHPE